MFFFFLEKRATKNFVEENDGKSSDEIFVGILGALLGFQELCWDFRSQETYKRNGATNNTPMTWE